MIHWHADAARRAGLSGDDLVLLSTAPTRSTVAGPGRVLFVQGEIEAIAARNPEWFGSKKWDR